MHRYVANWVTYGPSQRMSTFLILLHITFFHMPPLNSFCMMTITIYNVQIFSSLIGDERFHKTKVLDITVDSYYRSCENFAMLKFVLLKL